jgi:hypothetical protein
MSDSRNIFNNASNPYLPSFNNNASSNNMGLKFPTILILESIMCISKILVYHGS